jgi:hypothetical protein
MATSLAYTLHDSVVTTTLEKEDRLVLEIELYPLYYPTESTVHLILSGISNAQELAAFQLEVTARARQNGQLGYRIDEFKYAGDSLLRQNQIGLYLAVDHLPPLVTWCKKYRFAKENTER